MPDITLCANAPQCDWKEKCFRNPEIYEPSERQSWAFFKGTESCPKVREKENEKGEGFNDNPKIHT